MERSVVDDEIEAIVHEGEGIELRLETGKERSEIFFVVKGSTQSVTIVGEQIDSDRRVTFKS